MEILGIGLHFEDLPLGRQFRTVGRTVTETDIVNFCTCTGMIRFFHPQMIAQAINKPSATIDEMIDFLFRALEPRKAK